MRNPYDAIGRIGLFVAIAGAINWLLVGLFEWNLVQWLFTQSGTQIVDSMGERIVYVVVGVGGVMALPMLAATLARSRSHDVSSEERGRSTADLSESDTDFYRGALKNDRELAREPQHVRRVERVIVEEPMPETSATTSAAETSAESTTSVAGTGPRSPEESLRYGTVEETDESPTEDYDERRRAA